MSGLVLDVYGANQYIGPIYTSEVCFMAATAAGIITTSVNKGRRTGPMNGLLLLDVYEITYETYLR